LREKYLKKIGFDKKNFLITLFCNFSFIFCSKWTSSSRANNPNNPQRLYYETFLWNRNVTVFEMALNLSRTRLLNVIRQSFTVGSCRCQGTARILL